MQILMVTSVLPDPDASSGGARVMYGQLAAAAAHHEMTLATLAWGDVNDGQVLRQLEKAGVEVYAVQRRWRRRWRLAPAWLRTGWPLRPLHFADARMQRLLERILAQRRHDLIQVEDSAMGGYRYPAAIAAVLTDHDVRTPLPAPHNGEGRHWVARAARAAEQRRWPRYQVATWRKFDRIQVFTPRDAGAIQTMAPELAARVRVNPFGVDLPPVADTTHEEAGSVLFVGAFMHPPNVDAALWLGRAIMPQLRRLCPGVRLVIVGSDPPPSVQALTSGDITVTGQVPDVGPFLERASVVIAPLRTGGGMRVKVLQAMATSKAVVTTPLGAEGLAATGGTAPLGIADSAVGLASLTAELLAAGEARRLLGQRARAFVREHHSWPAYGRRQEALYAELART